MAGSRCSKDINKSFFLSQFLSFGLSLLSGSLFRYGRGAANTLWLLFAAKNAWVTFCEYSNPKRKCFSFLVVLAKVLWLTLIESTESGIHPWTSHRCLGNTAPRMTASQFRTRVSFTQTMWTRSGRDGAQGRIGMLYLKAGAKMLNRQK